MLSESMYAIVERCSEAARAALIAYHEPPMWWELDWNTTPALMRPRDFGPGYYDPEGEPLLSFAALRRLTRVKETA